MIQGELALVVQALLAERRPFVVATVVRARRPTSVRPGDTAIVLADGSVEGFVGGVCAESSVRLHGLRAIETGEPLLLRLIPGPEEGAGADDALEGAVIERNPCLSGGALEIFLEPHLPAARVLVVGDSPVAAALETLAGAAGFDCVRVGAGAGAEVADAGAVIVACHGNDEEAVLAEALSAGVPYVALVASVRRGGVIRDGLDVPVELRAQLHTPAGLDIGARTPVEIAISILAEMVAEHRADLTPPRSPLSPAVADEVVPAAVPVAVDPVCGMQVAVVAATPRLEVQGATFYFCGGRCRAVYAVEHAQS